MPAADELFRTTAGNGTLVREGREAHGEDGAERSARDRGHNQVAPPNAPGAPAAAGSKGPAKTVPAPTVSAEQVEAAVQVAAAPSGPAATPSAPAAQSRKVTAPRRPSGRERHDEKITVYVSAGELVDLEHARLTLRAEHGIAVDRGRIVREALAVVLADLEAKHGESILVRRLAGR
jgi:hypothetical protein